MFNQTHQKRRWATRVLIVWLFSIVASVANCAPSLADTRAAEVPAVTHSQAHHAGHDADHGAPKTNCERYCELSTSSAPASQLLFADLSMPAIGVVFYSALSLAPLSEPRTAMRPVARDGPPIVIALLRLAL